MKKREAGFQVKFKHWLEANQPKTSAAYELKYVESGNFPIAQWIKKQPHQLRGLLNSSVPGKMCYHKISDMSAGQSPFDCFVLVEAEAYLVVFFKEHKSFIMVNAKTALFLTQEHKTISFKTLQEHGVSHSLS